MSGIPLPPPAPSNVWKAKKIPLNDGSHKFESHGEGSLNCKEEYILKDNSNLVKDDEHPYPNFKILIIQCSTFRTMKQLADDLTKMIEKEINKSKRSPDFVILPESIGMVAMNFEEKNFEPVAGIAKKYSLYIICGSLYETSQKLVYNSCAVLNRSGNFLAKYRKRKPLNPSSPAGNVPCIIDTDFGIRIAILICFDIENDDILRENMAYKPDIIFNPVFIPRSIMKENKDQIYNRWKVALQMMSYNFEHLSLNHDFCVIRCDHSDGACYASGSSQLIAPDKTIYPCTFRDCVFPVFVGKKSKGNINHHLNSFSQCTVPSTYIRTQQKDNNGNRYYIHTFERTSWKMESEKEHGHIRDVCFYDVDLALSSSASMINVLNLHNYSSKNHVKLNSYNITNICSRSSQKAFLSASDDSIVRYWDLETMKTTQMVSLANYNHSINAQDLKVTTSPKHSRIMVMAGQNILLLDPNDMQKVATTLDEKRDFLNCQFIDENQFLTAVKESSIVKIWDMRNLKSHVCELNHKSLIVDVSIGRHHSKQNGDHHWIHTITKDGSINSWSNVLNHQPQVISSKFPFSTKENHTPSIVGLHGKACAVIDSGSVYLFHIKKKEIAHEFWDLQSDATCIRFDHSHRILVGMKSLTTKLLEFTSNKVPSNFCSMFP